MSRPRSSKRQQAYLIWEKSNRTASPKEIAGMLGVSPSLVSKWKSLDGWEAKSLPNSGAPKGNKNATGNRGGGAPQRNTNAGKHGAYSKIYRDTLNDNEKALLDSIDFGGESIIRQQIQDMIITARRLRRRIKALEERHSGMVLDGKVTERTPRGEKTVKYSASIFDRIIQLEVCLDRTQLHIVKAVDILMRHRNEQKRLTIEQRRLKLYEMKAMGFIDIDPDDSGFDDSLDDSDPDGL